MECSEGLVAEEVVQPALRLEREWDLVAAGR